MLGRMKTQQLLKVSEISFNVHIRFIYDKMTLEFEYHLRSGLCLSGRHCVMYSQGQGHWAGLSLLEIMTSCRQTGMEGEGVTVFSPLIIYPLPVSDM